MSKPIEPIYILFGARVLQIRDALGITQEDFCKRLGMSRGSVANIETGRQRILLADVERFSKALGTTPKNLMKGVWL